MYFEPVSLVNCTHKYRVAGMYGNNVLMYQYHVQIQ